MAEFTKEQLIAEVHYNLEHCFCSEKTKRLMEIALAAMTAEPFMYASEETLICAEQGEFLLRTLNRPAGDATIPLYRLPLLEGLK